MKKLFVIFATLISFPVLACGEIDSSVRMEDIALVVILGAIALSAVMLPFSMLLTNKLANKAELLWLIVVSGLLLLSGLILIIVDAKKWISAVGFALIAIGFFIPILVLFIKSVKRYLSEK